MAGKDTSMLSVCGLNCADVKEDGHSGNAKRLESSEVVRQAYGYGLFTDHVELVMKRAAMLL